MTSLALRRPTCGDVLGPTRGFRRARFRCSCAEWFPIICGIPRSVGSDGYAGPSGQEWNHFPRTQGDSANGTRIRYQRFRQVTRVEPESLCAGQGLEAGSETGRFLAPLGIAGVLGCAADLSVATDAAAESLREHGSCKVRQARVHDTPFSGDFDLVFSLGVRH